MKMVNVPVEDSLTVTWLNAVAPAAYVRLVVAGGVRPCALTHMDATHAADVARRPLAER